MDSSDDDDFYSANEVFDDANSSQQLDSAADGKKCTKFTMTVLLQIFGNCISLQKYVAQH